MPHPSVKDSILQSIMKSSTLGGVVTTIAFGMGLNFPNIARVNHCESQSLGESIIGLSSSDIKSYLQETGRADRDGVATLSLF